jgi:iron complex transport system substrate-binding protein
MNKNPQNPQERYQYKTLKSKFIKVDEFDFARPGISSFESVLKLNKTFNEKR